MRLFVRAATLAVPIISFAACDLTTDPGAGFALNLELDRTVVWAPDGFTVTVRAVNQTNQAVVLAGAARCVLGYEITDQAGKAMHDPALGCRGGPQEEGEEPQLYVAPGDTLEVTEHMAGFLRWVPGLYRVNGVLEVEGKAHRTSPVEFQLQCRKAEWTLC